jgi:hypothetical protein
MSIGNTLDDTLNLRLSAEAKQAFYDRCGEYEVSPHEMLREMIGAFSAGKLRIIAPKNQLKLLRGIHHVD